MNIFDRNILKFNSSLKENVHILNKASQNINNIGNKNVHEKTCNYFEDTNNLMILQQKKFTQVIKNKSKDKHIIKYEKKFKTLQNMFVILVKNYVLHIKCNIELNHILIDFLQPFQS